MSIPRTWIRLALALAVLLIGLPLGALEAVAPCSQTGDGAGPSWLVSAAETPAAPETGASRGLPECSTVAAKGGAATVPGLRPGQPPACQAGMLEAGTPLYLSHCAFLC